MKSGLQTLHEIDTAIAKARKTVRQASDLPRRSSEALADIRRRQTSAYDQIANERLGLIVKGDGGDLGYVDRQAEKLLSEHADVQSKAALKVDQAVTEVEKLESARRKTEKEVQTAVDAYDKAAAKAEKDILTDPLYMSALDRVETAESTVIRAGEKLELARADEKEKGTPYRQDPFFSYLQKRGYGTKSPKGWFLTRWLDGWVASVSGYKKSAENYRRLQAIPKRLENHVNGLETDVIEARENLEKLEDEILEAKGVTALYEKSLSVQAKLDKIDEDIAGAEREYAALRDFHHRLTSGEDGPYREAVNILSEALTRFKFSDLRRLASQTTGRTDDNAIEEIIDLHRAADEIDDEQKEARRVVRKYEKTLRELEDIRRRFKSRRYDAPSSVFSGDLVSALLIQVLAGALDGDSLWRRIERAQRTIRRYSDSDFGGVDWTEGLRLPRSTGSRRRSPRIRTSIPRMPRTSLPRTPRIPRSSGGRSGGFRTGGGF